LPWVDEETLTEAGSRRAGRFPDRRDLPVRQLDEAGERSRWLQAAPDHHRSYAKLAHSASVAAGEPIFQPFQPGKLGFQAFDLVAEPVIGRKRSRLTWPWVQPAQLL
jgi:hypothetical protein